LQTETPLKSLHILDNITPRIMRQMLEMLPEQDPLIGRFYNTCALVRVIII
jgi:hypothetical protein